MADKERAEDLNPQDKDIEERVKQMLDPTLPDGSESAPSQPKGSSRIKIVDSSSDKEEKQVEATAPELTDTEETEPSELPKREGKTIKPPKEGQDASGEDKAPTERKIAVTDHGESPEELAQELDKAIAGLGAEEAAEVADQIIKDKSPDDSADGDSDAGTEPEETSSAEDSSEASDDEKADKADEEEPTAPVLASDESEDEETKTEAEDSDAEDNETSEGETTEDTEAEDEATSEDETTDDAEVTPEPEEPAEKVTVKREAQKTKKPKTSQSKPKKESKPQKTDEIESPATDKAVSDIIAKEPDDIPADKKQPDLSVKEAAKTKKRRKFPLKPILWLFGLALLAGLTYAAAVPQYRYRALNAIGVRASSSVTVTDVTTGQPLPNATVRLGNTTATTNQEGVADIGNLYLGDATLTIDKIAYGTYEESLTVGWGSNPLGERQLQPTGVQFSMTVTDFISGRSVAGASATQGPSGANADEKGAIKLTIPHTDDKTVTITLTADGYKSLDIEAPLGKTDLGEQVMVPAKKHMYLALNYDIYSAYVDGSDKTKLVEASGYEQDDLVFIPQSNGVKAAYISTRANNRNDQGALTYNLLMLDSAEGDSSNVSVADQIIPVGWINNSFIFMTVDAADESANKTKLQVYKAADGSVSNIATSSYFNDVHIADGRVYFAPSSAVEGGTPAKLYSTRPDGSDRKVHFDDEVWKMFRNNYERLALSIQDVWYQHNVLNGATTPLKASEENRQQRSYVDGPDGKQAAVVIDSDLKLYTIETRKTTDLVTDQAVIEPVYWYNDTTVIYRALLNGELVQVAVDTQNGERITLPEVADMNNTDGWYFY